jgi:hypothetical protein
MPTGLEGAVLSIFGVGNCGDFQGVGIPVPGDEKTAATAIIQFYRDNGRL